MTWNLLFFLNSILLGVGLAMDAFSVSVANGLKDPRMRKRRMCVIAGTFAGFQGLMPLIGWFCVNTVASHFSIFAKCVPAIALALLLFIGIKMIVEALRAKKQDEAKDAGNRAEPRREKERKSAETAVVLGAGTLIVQGIATSIDALSVGFAVARYTALMAVVCALIIAFVTFAICIGGLVIGKKAGHFFSGKAEIVGGIILIGIGCEIFITGYFF